MKIDKFLLITVGALAVIVLILLAFGGAAFLCLFVTNAPVTNEGAIVQKSYDYNGSLAGYDNVRLDIGNINGVIDVREGDADSYAINVNARGTEKDLQRYQVQFTPSDENGVRVLKLEIKDMKEPRLINSKYNADITVTVPKGKTYEMNLATVNGNVDVGAFNCSKAMLASVNGALDSQTNSANTTMVTVNGNINLRTDATKGDIFLNTVNGAVKVTIPANSSLSLNAHSVNGAITADLPMEIAQKSRMELVGKTANYTEGIYIEASIINGSIDIRGR